MPIIRSAKKKLRQDHKKEKRNLTVRSQIKKIIKEFKKKPTAKLLSQVFSALDMSVKKKILHHNKASRLKSNFSKLLSDKPSRIIKPKAVARKTAAKK